MTEFYKVTYPFYEYAICSNRGGSCIYEEEFTSYYDALAFVEEIHKKQKNRDYKSTLISMHKHDDGFIKRGPVSITRIQETIVYSEEI